MARRTLAGLALVALTMGLAAPADARQSGPPDAAGGRAVPNQYIVVLHDSVGDPGAVAAEHRRDHGARVAHVYRHAIKGYAAQMSAQAAARITNDRRVAYVEADQTVTTFEATVPTGVDRVAAPTTSVTSVPHLTIDGADDLRVDVDVAVIDTGIDHNHPDLVVVGGANCATGGPFNSNCKDGLPGDGNGHGTHVGGTIGAVDGGGVVGVAPGARLWAVRVLGNNGSGYMSWIVAGIDWITARSATIEVANMSLGCACTSAALDSAITRSVNAGITYVVAAGNSNANLATSDYSPAKHPQVITVSALSDGDGRSGGQKAPTCRNGEGDDVAASFTNFDSSGSFIDMAAPGVCIRSTVPGDKYATYSGTSMASPHVAGAAALLASKGAISPTQVKSTLVTKGNLGWTDTKNDGKHEKLLDVSDATTFTPATVAGSATGGGGDPPPAHEGPTAGFTSACDELACDFTDTSTAGDAAVVSWSWTFGDGGTSTAQNPGHTYAAGGSYTVELTVTDAEGAEDSASQTVTVSAAGTLDVSLAGQGFTLNRNFWRADVTVTVTQGGSPASGVSAAGNWSTGGSGSCTTGTDGTCTITSGNLRNNVSSTTFTLTAPEPGPSITVDRP